MKKLFAALLLATFSLTSMAQDGDLILHGEKWIASAKGYICSAYGTAVEAPADFAKLNVKFEKITSDSTLDSGLIKATFTENGKACRYNAIVFADNAASTYRIVTSKAYAPADNSACAEGRAILDAAFAAGEYLYWGHPHNLTFMVPVEGADVTCPGATHVGVNFVVSGRVK